MKNSILLILVVLLCTTNDASAQRRRKSSGPTPVAEPAAAPAPPAPPSGGTSSDACDAVRDLAGQSSSEDFKTLIEAARAAGETDKYYFKSTYKFPDAEQSKISALGDKSVTIVLITRKSNSENAPVSVLAAFERYQDILKKCLADDGWELQTPREGTPLLVMSSTWNKKLPGARKKTYINLFLNQSILDSKEFNLEIHVHSSY